MLKQFLLKNWQDLIGGEKPKVLNIATISSCNDVYGNDLVLLFIGNEREPQFVLKVVRDSRYNFKLERENYALVALRHVDSVKKIIPVSYASGSINGRYYFIQQGVSGQNLRNLLQTSGLNDKNKIFLEQSISILCAVNMAHKHIDVIQNQPGHCDPYDIISRKNDFESVGIDYGKFRQIIEAYDYISALRQKFFLHGDFWPANILVDEKKHAINGIIDWEFSEPNSSVPTDIIWFLITVSNAVHGYIHYSTSLFDSFKWAFFSEGEHNEIFKEYYHQYMIHIGLSGKKIFRPLLLLSLAGMSMREKLAYGAHNTMDKECLELLNYALKYNSYMEDV